MGSDKAQTKLSGTDGGGGGVTNGTALEDARGRLARGKLYRFGRIVLDVAVD